MVWWKVQVIVEELKEGRKREVVLTNLTAEVWTEALNFTDNILESSVDLKSIYKAECKNPQMLRKDT